MFNFFMYSSYSIFSGCVLIECRMVSLCCCLFRLVRIVVISLVRLIIIIIFEIISKVFLFILIMFYSWFSVIFGSMVIKGFLKLLLLVMVCCMVNIWVWFFKFIRMVVMLVGVRLNFFMNLVGICIFGKGVFFF